MRADAPPVDQRLTAFPKTLAPRPPLQSCMGPQVSSSVPTAGSIGFGTGARLPKPGKNAAPGPGERACAVGRPGRACGRKAPGHAAAPRLGC